MINPLHPRCDMRWEGDLAAAPTWQRAFPELSGLSPQACAVLAGHARSITTPCVEHMGRAEALLMVTAGTAQVHHVSCDGRQTPPSPVTTGQGCFIGQGGSVHILPADSNIIEPDVVAMIVPIGVVEELIFLSKAFRAFIFDLCCKHINGPDLVVEGRFLSPQTNPKGNYHDC